MPDAPRLPPGGTGRRPPLALGVLCAAVLVATATALVYPLAQIAPVEALGVVYIVAVLAVSSVWGGWLGAATALASAMAFNFFHIPPTGRLSVAEGENWVALAVLFIAAIVSSSLSDRARLRALEAEQRRQEADLAAEMARLLLRGTSLPDALPTVSRRLATALDLPSAAVELGSEPGDERRRAFALHDGERQIGTLLTPAGLPVGVDERLRTRVIPSLEALLAAALEREALQDEVVETAALRRSDVLKTALLRAVSHDLRSPLTAILTATGALGASTLTRDEHDELVVGIAAEADRLSRLIDKLLDLSRLEADVAPPRTDWCSIEEVIDGAIAALDAPPGQFATSIADELPQVRADPAQLERAFANLLENAARHGVGHPVSVRARAVGGRLVVRIVDRGPGIAPAEAERIFEPFYRGRDDRTGPGGHRGAGLGLAIARGFVEVNGGRIWVESLPGQGSSFVVALPLQPLPDVGDPRSRAASGGAEGDR